jgi:hypothetical protein
VVGVHPPETSLRVTLAAEDRPVGVIPCKETPEAAQVTRTVGVLRIRDLQPYLRLHAQGIEVAPAPAGSDVAPLLDKIKRIPNIPLTGKPAMPPR